MAAWHSQTIKQNIKQSQFSSYGSLLQNIDTF